MRMGVEKENPDRAIPIPSPPGDSWPRGIRPGEGRIQVNSLLNAENECPESARFKRGAIYGPGWGGIGGPRGDRCEICPQPFQRVLHNIRVEVTYAAFS